MIIYKMLMKNQKVNNNVLKIINYVFYMILFWIMIILMQYFNCNRNDNYIYLNHSKKYSYLKN